MRKFIVSPNPSSNFSNSSFLANKKAPDHSGLEPGQTLIAALGGSAQVCSVIRFPRTPLCGPHCPPSLSQITSPSRTPSLWPCFSGSGGWRSLCVNPVHSMEVGKRAEANRKRRRGGGSAVGVGTEERQVPERRPLSCLLFPARRARHPWLGDSEVTVKRLP